MADPAETPPAPEPSPAPAPAAPPAPPPSAAPVAGDPPARPDFLPEKFWKDGAPQVEQLAKSYSELEKQRGKFAESAKATARTDLEKELFANRPETVDGYALALADDAEGVSLLEGDQPADFQPVEGQTYLALNPDSPALGMLRGLAHRAGASPAEWSAMLTQFARENGQRIPTQAERDAEASEIYKQLGEHGQRRVQFAWGALKTVLGDKAAALDSLAGSAAAIEAIEELVQRATGSRFAPPSAGAGPGGMLTEAELRAKMNTPEYAAGDQAVHAEVARGWKALFPS